MIALLVILAAIAAAILLQRNAGRARMRLRRKDGRVYLDRWGVEWKPLGGIFVHRMQGPDPGQDVHDHPWPFVSLILKGGYIERRCDARSVDRQHYAARKRGSLRLMRLDEAHTITRLVGETSWSLVIHGRHVRSWGFYVMPSFTDGRWVWIESGRYAVSPRGKSRDMATEIHA